MNPKQEMIDFTTCRAVFAAWVFVYHVDLYLNFSAALGPFAGLVRHGYMGVDGFFILSGIVLARVHPELLTFDLKANLPRFQLPRRDAVFNFWFKRFARIYPVHLATILLLGGIFLLGELQGWAPRGRAHFGLSSLVENLFLIQGWGLTAHGSWNYPSWSVSTEWAGYLLFPLLWVALACTFAALSFQVMICCIVLLGFLISWNHGTVNLGFDFGLLRFIPEFICGVCFNKMVGDCADLSFSASCRCVRELC